MSLHDILDATWEESDRRKRKTSLKSLKLRVRDLPPTLGFGARIAERRFSVIAEIKTKSPSIGAMSPDAERTAHVAHLIYQAHPVVSAISVLTQETHFGGSEARLRMVRRQTRKPILRKDFIRDEYEVYFSRAIGADAILLMANVVSEPKRFADLHDLAVSLGLDVLCEVHSPEELEILPASVRICGINSRKFKSDKRFLFAKITRHVSNMDVTTELGAFDLFKDLPVQALKIAESGMNSQNLGSVLEKYSFDAALIGTSLLRGGRERVKQELDRLGAAIEADQVTSGRVGANQPRGPQLAHA